MYSERGSSDVASEVRRRAAHARERAERELIAAARQERLAERTGLALHERLALLHRRSARCHSTAAELQESYALMLARGEDGHGAPPRFMTGVAEACGTSSAALTLVGADDSQLAVAASDEPARAAQELEFVLGEGPARDAAAHCAMVRATGARLRERWPGYAAALVELGITKVVAVPLRLPQRQNCVGSLTVFDPRPCPTRTFVDVADALTRDVLLGPHATPDLYGGTDHHAVVHQAAGVLSVQAGCPVPDALELIKARAFSAGEPVHEVAERIVRHELRLD
ncbi:ANTAR domain-containing protein [Streptomyces sp. R21]|uniref:ANTAR domain-containing protein n=1 Tax=Streptomyces sp. R21 TaxID=3238627 RepID=A0AB39PDX3_9ACTN